MKITKQILCAECRAPFKEGEWIVEEKEGSLLLPPVHKVGCVEDMEIRNAMRKPGTIVWRFPDRPDGAEDEDLYT